MNHTPRHRRRHWTEYPSAAVALVLMLAAVAVAPAMVTLLMLGAI